MYKDKCVIIGLLVKYKDFVIGMLYVMIEVFKKVCVWYLFLSLKSKFAFEEFDAAAAASIELKIEVVIDVFMELEVLLV